MIKRNKNLLVGFAEPKLAIKEGRRREISSAAD